MNKPDLRSQETLAPSAFVDDADGDLRSRETLAPAADADVSLRGRESPGPVAQRAAVAPASRAGTRVEAPAEALAETPDRPSDVRVGTAVHKYQIVRELGRGGMGAVYLARDTRLGRLVAIKFLKATSPRLSARFVAEARTTAQCNHENIVILHEADEHEGQPYMVLEYVQGKTLREIMDERQAATVGGGSPGASPGMPAGMSPGRAVELIVPVLRALEQAHGMGIVHRDLKPENVMLTDSGTIKVLDFGIAKVLAEGKDDGEGDEEAGNPAGADDIARPHRTQGLLGTPKYMAPEQLNVGEVDHRADIWAVGMMLFELVAGQHPLAPVSLPRLEEMADVEVPMPRMVDIRPDLDQLGPIIDRALLKRAMDRTADVRAMLDELLPLAASSHLASHTDERNPFTGLSAFQEHDSGRFFGRDGDIASVVARVRNQPLVTVLGASGVGKSSLIRAGVIPRLKRSGEGWETLIVRPGRSPLAGLADVLAQLATRSSTANSDLPGFGRGERAATVKRLAAEPGYLGTAMRTWAGRKLRRVLLFVDQFEELYTLGIEASERTAYLACLAGVADDASSPLRVVLSMRADFLDRMAEDRAFMAVATPGLQVLGSMERAGLRAALTEPLAAVGYRYERADLIDSMLRELQATPGALPLLQFAATSLWERRDGERRLLTVASYEAMGGIGGALAQHADRVLAGMSAARVKLARLVLTRLVTPEHTRALVEITALLELADDAGAMEQVVRDLADARLLLIESGERGSSINDSGVIGSADEMGGTVELVHESLIGSWPTLTGWLDTSRHDAHFVARVRTAAREWRRHGRSDDLLWRGQAAVQAMHWHGRADDDQAQLGPVEREYVHAVAALATRARRRRRMLAVAGLAVVCAVAVVVALLAARASREARQARTSEARERRSAVAAKASAAAAKASAVEAIKQAAGARNASRLARAMQHRSDPMLVMALVREMEPEGPLPPRWRELAREVSHQDIAQVVLTHQAEVFSAAFSPDGTRFVTASGDKAARVWNADGIGEPIVLTGHQDRVFSAAFSPDGTRIVTASFDRTARVWDRDGVGTPIVLRGHEGHVYIATFHPDGQHVLTGSADACVRIFNLHEPSRKPVTVNQPDEIWGAAFSPDGTRFATGGKDGIVRLYDTSKPAQPRTYRHHTAGVNWVEFSPDGTKLATASWDSTAQIVRLDDSSSPVVFDKHESAVWSARFNSDGTKIVTASLDKTVQVWSVDDPSRSIILLRGHQAEVMSAAFSPDDTRIITASQDRTARLWDADGVSKPIRLRGHQANISSAVFSPDGTRIVTASFDKTARVWNADGKGVPVILQGHEGRVYSAIFSPDGSRIITASDDKTARVWNADGSGEPVVLDGHHAPVHAAAFNADGTRIVTASWDTTVRIWNADGSGEPIVLTGHQDRVSSAAFSPDGTRIVTASWDKTARVWNADGSGEPIVLAGHQDGVQSAAFSPDGARMITASWDKTARVWRMDQPKAGSSRSFVTLRGHGSVLASSGGFGGWAFSPDGARVVTIADDQTLRIWNADGTGEPAILSIPELNAYSAAFSPDGTRIVTASHSERDPATGEMQYWATVWPTFERFTGLDDPALWTATRHCPPPALREHLLGEMPEGMAEARFQRCQERVAAAFAAQGGRTNVGQREQTESGSPVWEGSPAVN